MTLHNKTFIAVRWTVAAAFFSALLKLAQMAVLVRLLAPEDYGLMAMVTVVLGFGGVLADLGLNSAYLQRRDVTPEQRSSLFWTNVGMSGGLSLLVVSTSSLIAVYFGDDRLTPLLMLSALTFILSALGQQLRIIAQKNLNFGPLVILETMSTVVGFATAVALAVLEFGVYALVWGAIVSALTGTMFAWSFISNGWRPMWRFQYKDIKPFLGFGGAMVGSGIVNQINMTIDLLLGGRMLAASQLGLYSVPRNLVLQLQFMVNPIITRVGFPLIAEVQHDIKRVRKIYLKTLNMTVSTNAPLYIGIAFFAPEIVQVYLGEKWTDVVNLLRILAIWGLIRSVHNPLGSLLFGMGRAGLSLQWNLALLFIVPPVLWFGSLYGTIGLAWSLLGIQAAAFFPGWYVLVRPLCDLKFAEYAFAALRPILITVVAVAPAYWLTLPLDEAILTLAVAIVVSAPLYLGVSFVANREWFGAMLELAGRKS